VTDIAAEPGVAGLLIGRSDLALSMGADSPGHPDVLRAVETIVGAGRRYRKVVMVALGGRDEIAEFAGLGASSFVVGSDQSLLREAASQLQPALQSLLLRRT
jgi:2-keto-3-deoxy-L-rhamnonate aldolase RhmA